VNPVGQVTVDLDVQVRDDLLSFLKEDSENRSATVLCAPAKVPHVMRADGIHVRRHTHL
jgi:ABC-type uncharacterized transport system ATPase subunit